MPNENPLLNALKGMVLMFDKVAGKVNWGQSCLDADTIRLMNESLVNARRAIIDAEPESPENTTYK